MKRIASADSLAEIGHFRNVLEQNGIRCLIKNEQLSGALGEVPVFEALPELWVINDGDRFKAEQLLKSLQSEPVSGSDWRCPKCGEANEAQFAACWNCGTAGSED